MPIAVRRSAIAEDQAQDVVARAPSAMRMPSSRVRCCTENASTPKMPTGGEHQRQRREDADQLRAESRT